MKDKQSRLEEIRAMTPLEVLRAAEWSWQTYCEYTCSECGYHGEEGADTCLFCLRLESQGHDEYCYIGVVLAEANKS